MTTETILTDEDLDRCNDFLKEVPYDVDYDLDHIHRACRNTEQAVLQSPEVQALRKDAERYRYLKRGRYWVVATTQTGFQVDSEDLDALIDNDLEQQK